MKKYLQPLLFFLLLNGCQKHPSADSSAVKEHVLSAIKEKLYNMHYSKERDRLINVARGSAGWDRDLDHLNKVKEKVNTGYFDDAAAEYARNKMESINLSLKAIRTLEINDEAKMIICAAELHYTSPEDAGGVNIRYSAQYDEDGELYVRVIGNFGN
jgi:hypothetical protein